MPSDPKPKVVIWLTQHWMSSTSTQWNAHVDLGWRELQSVTWYTSEAEMRKNFDELKGVLESLGFDVEVRGG